MYGTIPIKKIHRGIFGRKLRRTFIVSRTIGVAKLALIAIVFLAAVISWSLGIRDNLPKIRPISLMAVVALSTLSVTMV